jgi:sarcosine oxidase subunit beta
LRDKFDVVIVGGGAIGLSTAYQLAKGGLKVLVLEKKFLGGGTSTRFPASIRSFFTVKENVSLAVENLKMFKSLSKELKLNLLFHRNGSLAVAYTEKEVEILKEAFSVQRSLNVKNVLVHPRELREIVPDMNVNGVLLALFNPNDAAVHHDAVVWAYAEAARRLGAKLRPHTRVVGFDLRAGKIKLVKTDRGDVETSIVVNAAGWQSSDVAKMAGIDLPSKPQKHEAMATEPFKRFLNPTLFSLHSGIRLNQTLRGEVVGSMKSEGKTTLSIQSLSLESLQRIATEAVKMLPALRYVRVIRQWAGIYDMTLDGSPILGFTEEVENLVQANGFGGLGVAFSPIVGKLLAELIITGKPSIPIDSFSLKRFESGKMLNEKTAWLG